jgi:hypothetical protein
VRRVVILATLTLLLLAVTGITLAGEGAIDPAGDSLTESTVQDTTTTTGEPTATTVMEPTSIADEETTERTEPTAGSGTETSIPPEPEEFEVTEEEATEAGSRNVGKPESNGNVQDNGAEANGGGGRKVTLCHKGKKTLTVGEPALDAHLLHNDTVGPCQTVGAKPNPPEGKPGSQTAQNGDGGGQKVTLCHKGKKTLTVGAPALAAHLRHGDTEGPCAGQ